MTAKSLAGWSVGALLVLYALSLTGILGESGLRLATNGLCCFAPLAFVLGVSVMKSFRVPASQ